MQLSISSGACLLLMWVSTAISNMFDDSLPRPFPLILCENSTALQIVTVPLRPSCTLSRAESSTLPAIVTVWKQDLTRYTLPAITCSKEKHTLTCASGFSYAEQRIVEYLPVSIQECKDYLVQHGPASKVHLEKEIRSGSYPYYRCGFLRMHESSTIMISLSSVNISYTPGDMLLQQTLPFAQQCSASQSHCSLLNGDMVLWDVNLTSPLETCSAAEHSTDSCIIDVPIESNLVYITCPTSKLTLSLDATFPSSYCVKNYTSAYLYQTEQGNYVSFSNSTHELCLNDLLSGIQGCNRSDVPLTISSSLSIAASEIMYAYESLANQTSSYLKQLSLSVCRLYEHDWVVAQALHLSHPELAIQLYTGNKMTTGFQHNNKLYIWQCIPVSSYRFMLNPNCYSNWPTEYTMNNRTFVTYLQVQTLRLTSDPGEKNCLLNSRLTLPYNTTHSVDLSPGSTVIHSTATYYKTLNPSYVALNLQDSGLYKTSDLISRLSYEDTERLFTQYLSKKIDDFKHPQFQSSLSIKDSWDNYSKNSPTDSCFYYICGWFSDWCERGFYLILSVLGIWLGFKICILALASIKHRTTHRPLNTYPHHLDL